jgi:hypothetical protein
MISLLRFHNWNKYIYAHVQSHDVLRHAVVVSHLSLPAFVDHVVSQITVCFLVCSPINLQVTIISKHSSSDKSAASGKKERK